MDTDFLTKAIEMVETNLTDVDFTTEALSQNLFLSRSQLHRRLINLTGKNTSEFIRDIRLKKAAELLETSHKNVSEVAYGTGFSHLSWFAKCFKEKYTLSPSMYKKRYSFQK